MTFGQVAIAIAQFFCLPAVPGLIASNILCQITQQLLNQMLRYFIYD